MTTRLTKRVSRIVEVPGKGSFVVTLQTDGVTIRKFRKRRSVSITWTELAKAALQARRYALTEDEWADPLKSLAKLRRLPRL